MVHTVDAKKIRVTFRVFCCLLALIAAFISCAFLCTAQAHAAQPDSTSGQTVKVGYYESRAFQEGASDDAIKDGFGYEYLQRVAAYAGWRYEYVYGSWSDLYEKLVNGEIDILAGVAKTGDRVDEVLFSNASMLNETFYLYENNSEAQAGAADPSGVDRQRVGIIRNSNAAPALEEWIAENDISPQVVSYKDKNSLSSALRKGKIDAFVSSDNVTYDLTDIAPVQIVGKEPYYLAVTPKRHDLLAGLNDAQTIISTQDRLFIDKLAAKYTVDTAVNKYLTRREAKWMGEHDSLTVGYTNSYLPYCGTDGMGNPTGLMLDVLGEILDKLPGNWDPNIDYVGFDDQHDLFDALKNGEVDIAFPVGGETWYSEQKGYLRSSPVTSPTVDLIYLGSSNYADATRTIAVNSNNDLQENYVHFHYPEAQVIYFDSIEECLKAIKSGKAGSTVVNGLRAGSLLNNESNLVAVQLPDNDDRCFGVNADNSVLLQILNRGLGIIGSDFGTNASYLYMDSLYHYSLADLAFDYWPFVLATILAMILFILAGAVRHVNKLQREREHEAQQNKILEEALEKAEKASRAKDTLLNNLSHDIRTPLNGILGIIDVNGFIDDPAIRKENAKKAHKAADQLLAVVDELLEMTKLKSGEVEVALEPTCVADVVETCLDERRELAEQKQVSVSVREQGLSLRHARVMTSPVYLRQVLLNIIDNAIRYNKTGGEVAVTVTAEKTEGNRALVAIEVADTGIGMSPEHVDKIFEPFFQGHSGARSIYPGSGLGMSIVKEIVDLLGGSIAIESKEGVGTRATVRFEFDLIEYAVESITASKEKSSVDGLRVLVVEDNDLNVEITKYALEECGVDVEVARDGSQAVTAIEESALDYYDGIVMDIMMPNMNGIEATKAIRALSRADAQRIPIIAITANILEDDKSLVFDAGMDAYLRKPLDVEELVRTLASLCR